MVVCKYFLEGRCAFGDDCRYEHVADSYGAPPEYIPSGGYRQPFERGGGYRHPRGPPQRYERPSYRPENDHQYRGHFSTQYRPPAYQAPFSSSPFIAQPAFIQPPPISDSEILEGIRKDVEEMWSQNPSGIFQKGKIWPFTSYSFSSSDGSIKTDPLFELNEMSIEELRCAAYASRQDPTAWSQFVTSVVNEGNRVRLICTNISNAGVNPQSEAARNIIAEVKSKSAQRASRLQTETQSVNNFNTPPSYPVATNQSPSTFPAQGISSSFSAPAPQMSSNIPQTLPVANGVYSDTNMLTAEDFEQFAAPEFVQGKIPYRPPPRNLC